jgi:hypothetical protein
MVKSFQALSVKQPWAALIVHGLKSIEVRSWSTRQRGLILIHASRQVDQRREGWNRLPPEAGVTVERLGGVIGMVEITDCLAYRSKHAFQSDCSRHLNEPDWYQERGLYGFVLAKPRLVPFIELPGWVKFFSVKVDEKRLKGA